MGPGSQEVCLIVIWGAEGAHKDPEVEKSSSELEEELRDHGSSGILMDNGLKTRQWPDQVDLDFTVKDSGSSGRLGSSVG